MGLFPRCISKLNIQCKVSKIIYTDTDKIIVTILQESSEETDDG